MNATQANSRERLQQAIDAEIESLEESLRALKLRRNALSAISSLPPEVLAAIFSLLCSSHGIPSLGGKPDQNIAQICVSHVCHQWREIILNQPLLWSHVDFTALSSAGVTAVLFDPNLCPYIWREGYLAVAGTMFDLVHSKKISRSNSPAYTTFASAQSLTISAIHLKGLCYLPPLSNTFHSIPVVDTRTDWTISFLSLTLFSMAQPLDSHTWHSATATSVGIRRS